MPQRPIRLASQDAAVADGLAALRAELEVPGPHGPAALAEAQEAVARPLPVDVEDATGIPLLTIDPPGSMDLDQALHVERRGAGYRVLYAIADVAAFVAPGGAIDEEAWARGTTAYAPDGRSSLHPPAIAEDAASLLPGRVRRALLWTHDLDAEGGVWHSSVRRAIVRSRLRLDYATAQARLDTGTAEPALVLLEEVGRLRSVLERERGGVHLPLPEQEVVHEDGRWAVRLRAPLPVEDHNAQISLMTGMAAAKLMVDAGHGLLRTVPEADPDAVARLRRTAAALGRPWPEEQPYATFVRTLDPTAPADAALLHEVTGVLRGARYVAFTDGAPPPAERRHAALAADYAHVTAPLRRLADRHVGELCLAAAAGRTPPGWALEALPRLPEAMAAADRRASRLDRGAVDLVEAAMLAGREGDVLRAIALDEDDVALVDVPVRARMPKGTGLDPGKEVAVRVEAVDVPARRVELAVAG